MKMKTLLPTALLLCAAPVLAQQTSIVPGAKVYVAPMDGNLNGFISAEILKQKLPVTVTTEESEAAYILSGQAQVSGHTGKGAGGLLNPYRNHDQYGGSVTLASASGHTVVWASDSDNGKIKQVAERIVKQMKHDLFPR